MLKILLYFSNSITKGELHPVSIFCLSGAECWLTAEEEYIISFNISYKKIKNKTNLYDICLISFRKGNNLEY